MFARFLFALLFADPLLACEPKDKPTTIRVTIVVVKASTTDKTINPKLKSLAEEVQKRNKEFTGLTIADTLVKSIPLGGKYDFELGQNQTATVTLAKELDKEGRVEVTIKLPGLDAVTYSCVCDKFFPLASPHKFETGENLLVAILAKPCAGK